MTYLPLAKGAGTTVEVDFGDKTESKKYAIGYWSIRGLGAPLTMMMCAAKTPFTLFLFDIVENESSWMSAYFGAKQDLMEEYQQPFWNLPFCVDRQKERVVCQTNAVFAHLGREVGMMGDSDVTTSICEQLLCEMYDLRNIMTDHVYGKVDNTVEDVIKGAKQILAKMEKWLTLQAKQTKQENVVHLVNGTFSAPDFHFYELLDQYEALAGASLYDGFKRVQKFKTGFAALPENQPYLNSWLHKELPFNNCMAKFGSLPGPRNYVHGKSAEEATWRGKGVTELSLSP